MSTEQPKLTASDVSFFLTCKDEAYPRFHELRVSIDIAIYEWRGWKYFRPQDGSMAYWQFEADRSKDLRILPSYVVGIAALGNCHDAEDGLTDAQKDTYYIKLAALVGYENPQIAYWYILHATARQRSIALCRVVNPELFA